MTQHTEHHTESYSLPLADADATQCFGTNLGRVLAAKDLRVILLYGDLGTGKTTFTRGLVAALPHGEEAEVSSPSFTLCNRYATTPPVLHCDLYRSEGALPEEVDEALDAAGAASTGTEQELVLVEWAERLNPAIVPPERLDIVFLTCHKSRLATLTPHGEAAGRVVQELIRCGCLPKHTATL